MDDETRRYIKAFEKRIDDLREADMRAVQVAHEDLKTRLEGFPQQFSTKDELKAIADIVIKLDKETVSRELYDQRHTALAERVTELDRTKLSGSVFTTFLDNYRLEQDNANTERRSVATALATATAREVGEKTGIGMSAGLLVAGLGVLGGLITIGLIVSSILR